MVCGLSYAKIGIFRRAADGNYSSQKLTAKTPVIEPPMAIILATKNLLAKSPASHKNPVNHSIRLILIQTILRCSHKLDRVAESVIWTGYV